MTIAYLDCFSGISGDMALGALIDCGVPLDELRAGLTSLPVEGWHLDAQPILQSGIHATDVTITLHGKSDADELEGLVESAPVAATATSHQHTHEHHHDNGHEHHSDHHPSHHNHDGHHHEHHHEHAHTHGRSMAEIRDIINASQLSARVKQTSLDIFWRIAEVEAKMHHSTPEEIHFHEIGGVDSLIDICGVAWCLEYLGVDEVQCSPLPYSTGFVQCAHGRMPIPAPATMELLKNVPMTPTDIKGEMVTPTGAGIVAALAKSFGPMPAMTPRHVGFGSGKKRFADRPNMLRVVVGESASSESASSESASPESSEPAHRSTPAGLEAQTLTVVESNIDDMNPEFYDYVMERLFSAGALDVWLQPLHMKRNRPAVLLSALCNNDTVDDVVAGVLTNTTTLGVRVYATQRLSLRRASQVVETQYGAVSVKVAAWPERELWRAVPEYSDVKKLAAQHNVAPADIYNAAANAAQELKVNNN